MKTQFDPEDFRVANMRSVVAAEIANAKLAEILANAIADAKKAWEDERIEPLATVGRSIRFPPNDAPDFMAALKDQWLAELKASATVVYTSKSPNNENNWDLVQSGTDTHRAYLIGVEEIAKQPCEHEPELRQDFIPSGVATFIVPVTKCKHCGVKLKATWHEEE